MRIIQILLVTLLTASSLISMATDFYLAKADLNVRNGAGTEYSVSFTVKEGAEVEVLSKNSSWYKIKYFGKIGYAYSKYLIYSRTKSDTTLNTHQQIVSYILIGAYVSLALFVFFIVYRKIRDNKLLKSVTASNRGTKSERDLVLRLLKYGIPAQNIFHDLYVEKHKGAFSQIDLVVITDVGIIAFEVKDYSGWIFGSENQSRWTQVLAYGKQKYPFYNPIMQNNKHVAELRRRLIQFENIPFYSVVVFYGNSVLKEIEFVTNGTYLIKSESVLDALKIILKDNKPVHFTNRFEIVQVLKQAVVNGGITENQIQHIKNINDMLGN